MDNLNEFQENFRKNLKSLLKFIAFSFLSLVSLVVILVICVNLSGPSTPAEKRHALCNDLTSYAETQVREYVWKEHGRNISMQKVKSFSMASVGEMKCGYVVWFNIAGITVEGFRAYPPNNYDSATGNSYWRIEHIID